MELELRQSCETSTLIALISEVDSVMGIFVVSSGEIHIWKSLWIWEALGTNGELGALVYFMNFTHLSTHMYLS